MSQETVTMSIGSTFLKAEKVLHLTIFITNIVDETEAAAAVEYIRHQIAGDEIKSPTATH